MKDEDVSTLVRRQADGVRWAVHQVGKALLVSSLIGLVACLFLGAIGVAVAGVVAGWYLVSSSMPPATRGVQAQTLTPVRGRGVMRRRATSFGAWADEYDQWRPTYPDAAVEWLVPPNGTCVVEVGAGTGKFTDRLVERHLDLDIVEPDGRMLALISRRHPGLRTHEAGAASLPIGDQSVDAVLVADAWHWFPEEEAAAEAARVLRPDGWLGCVWNDPAFRHDWEWRALRLDPALRPPSDFGPMARLGLSTGRAEQCAFRWTWDLTPQQWRGFVSTVSHVRLLSEHQRAGALDETERLVSQACESVGTATAPLTYDALCIRWYPEG